MSTHFENQDALTHVLGKRAEGMLREVHGAEMPGYLSLGVSVCKESALIFLLFWLFLSLTQPSSAFVLFMAFGTGWLAWKAGRSGWLAWIRLERLHRLVEQEKYEIEHHRPQEREELLALYQSKGFEGKLLEDVVDVLMADQDRLLKVMLEEEMGLTLEAFEHPLQQTLGAAVGAFVALVISSAALYFSPRFGVPSAALFLISLSTFVSARYERNKIIPALIWNLSIGALSLGVAYFLAQL